MKITTKLTLITTAIALLIGLILSFSIFNRVSTLLKERIIFSEISSAKNFMYNVNRLLLQAKRDIHILAEDELLRENLSLANQDTRTYALLQTELKERMELTGPWDALMVLDRDGKHIFSAGEHGGHGSISDYPDSFHAFNASMSGIVYVSEWGISDHTGLATIIYAAPIMGDDEKPVGSLIAHYRWSSIETLLDTFFVDEHVHLFDKEARTIAGSEGEEKHLKHSDISNLPLVRKALAGEPFGSQIGKSTYSEEESLMVMVSNGDIMDLKEKDCISRKWGAVVEVPADTLFEPATRLAWNSGLLIFAALLLFALLLNILMRMTLQPLQRLTELTTQIGNGDFTQTLDTKSGDEIGELSRNFNAMTTRLQRSTDKLTNSEQHLRRTNQTLITLREINQVLVYSTDEESLLQAVCRILHETGGYRFVWVGYAKHDIQKHVLPVAFAGEDKGYLDGINITWNDDEYGHGPTGTAIKTNLPIAMNNILTNPNYVPWREQALKRGYRSSIALPLLDAERSFGALNIYSEKTDAFDDEASRLLMEMATDLAFGISSLRQKAKNLLQEQQMSTLIEKNPDAILSLDESGNIEFANTAAELLFGKSAQELKGIPFGLPIDLETTIEIELLAKDSSGKIGIKIAELRLVDLNLAGEAKKHAFLHDITEKRRAEKLSSRMGRILEHSWNEIYIFNAETLGFIDVSLGGLNHLGYTLDELQKMTPLDIHSGLSREKFESLLRPLLEKEKKEISFEDEYRRKDGSLYPVEVRLYLSSQEYPPVFINIVQDISERKHYIAELEHKAQYDALTNLPNRLLLQDRLEQALKDAYQKTLPLAVITLSVLKLNEINDLLGYRNGDKILKEVSNRLLKMCRESDTVARLSDNKFVIVLPQADRTFLFSFAEKMQLMIQEPFSNGDLQLEIEFAGGISTYPADGDTYTTLLMHSDIAMRMAKKEGRAIRYHTPEDDSVSLRRIRLHGEFRQAIANRELVLYYQPQVDIKSGHIISVEALARWPHPKEGMIPPSEFVPIIEQSILIHPFTKWVLEEAVMQLRRWADMGIDLSIAVNLSSRNLLDHELPKYIAGLIEIHKVDYKKLSLEITESSLMIRPKQALDILNQLHEMGFELSIDDFGTGYSSLSYLQKLPVHEIKIDQSFVFGLVDNRDDAMIVRSTISLARSLGLKTVAEGVETKEMMEMLSTLGCDIAQGYYIAKPLDIKDLQQWLEDSPWGLY